MKGLIDVDELREFLHSNVDIGVRDLYSADSVFYFSGLLKRISNENVKLKTKIGYRIITIEEILEIRFSKERQQ